MQHQNAFIKDQRDRAFHAIGHTLSLIEATLEESKAEEIIVLDMHDRSALCDFIVIATARSHRHVHAVADHVLECLRQNMIKQLKIEGLEAGDWVLIDAGDIIIHLLRPEIRDFYNIDKLFTEPLERTLVPQHKRSV